MNDKYYDIDVIKALSNILCQIKVSDKLYNVSYLINGLCIDSAEYTNIHMAIRDSSYYLKSLSHKVDQVKIYKHGNLIAELNK